MQDLDTLEMLVKARGDQAAAMARELLPVLRSIADRDPATWTHDEGLAARAILHSVCGWLLEGRL